MHIRVQSFAFTNEAGEVGQLFGFNLGAGTQGTAEPISPFATPPGVPARVRGVSAHPLWEELAWQRRFVGLARPSRAPTEPARRP